MLRIFASYNHLNEKKSHKPISALVLLDYDLYLGDKRNLKLFSQHGSNAFVYCCIIRAMFNLPHVFLEIYTT